jgi:Polymer-forming cytoskeletal
MAKAKGPSPPSPGPPNGPQGSHRGPAPPAGAGPPSSSATQGPQRRIACYHCHHEFDIGTHAKTGSCPKCSKRLLLEDVVVKALEAVRRIQTCGKVIVQKKGRVIAQLVEAKEGVFVEAGGILEANVVSGGLVKISSKATWKGDCRAPRVVIEDGCLINGGYFEVPSAQQPFIGNATIEEVKG